MLLSPHHFQQWDNYFEDLVASRLGALMPYEWGVIDLQINRDSVRNGFFEVEQASVVMPDGMIVNIPHVDPAPDPRPLEGHFDPTTGVVDVHLAVPAKRVGAPNFLVNGSDRGQVMRYVQVPGAAVDETTGENEVQIAYARGNLQLLFGDELHDGYSSIKIGEIEKTATGQWGLLEQFVPPALNTGASAWLSSLHRQIVEILITKSTVLGDQRRQRSASLADFTTSEVAVFWLLHTVNSSIPILAHLHRTRQVHPERLYEELARLVGELMTFATDRHPKDIVRYDHLDLYYTFSALAAEIRDLLETVIPTKCVQIPLENTRESLYVGRILDERLLADAAFYLAVRAQVSDGQLLERVPRVIKIASRDLIDAVVGQALPGVPIMHQSPPPAPIPTRVGFHYFGLDRVGAHWDKIRGSRTISVYVPDEFPEVKLELYAVKP